MYTQTVSYYQNRRDTGLWQDVKNQMKKKAILNTIFVIFILIIMVVIHFNIRTLELQSWGIVLVGLGAFRLALISARVHMRRFYDSTNMVEAVEDRKTTEFRPRVAGQAVDAFIGFMLVAIGFTVRVGAEIL